ncbi:MAG: hypothetical protein M3Q10_12290 [Chloroflexota bacterium]|nr:hypothetical protein [Chloroflexota bacterium]
MPDASVFLIGGGWTAAAFPHTYGRFAAAAAAGTDGPPRIACVLLDGEERDAYFARSAAAFAAVGIATVEPVFVSPERPLRPEDVAGANGILVGGGLTPAYHEAIVPTADAWLPSLLERGVPYAGFSAGAAIAPARAIVGGWKLRRGGADLVVCAEETSEDREQVDVRPGLGLVPFAVDVHASQWGTATRLLHAVRAGLVPEGWAVDEDTMLEVGDNVVAVHGLGGAYRVRPAGDGLSVEILHDGDRRNLA